MGKILDATPICEKLKKRLESEIAHLPHGLCLASLKVGNDYSSQVYYASQKKLAREFGVKYVVFDLGQESSQRSAIKKIEELNNDKRITGIMIQKPFPPHWDEGAIFSALSYKKDIEGICPYNLSMLCLGKPLLIPPTVLSVLELLKSIKVDLYAKNVTVVGFSTIIGKPLVFLLGNNFATVTLTHIATYEARKLPFYIKNADIVISAVGKPHIIKGAWIKKGAIVIDVGTAKAEGKITGDVEFDGALKKASFVSPVPGGVGKLTPLFLFQNLLKAATL
jgi:methylenetetrahydrofolate dehydrogenase (NADP+)/methenyltetrahydrofolate cyclohydrolase